MNELQLSNDLTTIETEIKSYQNIAGQSIFEIGRRLKHVKENDLAHGEWIKWLKTINMNRSQATKFIKVSDEFSNGSLTNHLGVNVLYEIATLPEEERTKEHTTAKGEIKTPNEMTEKELRELKKQLKQRDEQNAQLQSQVEQAHRSESIARKKLEDEQNREPEVVEREVVKEVVPDEIQQQLEQFKQKFERESNNANQLRDELQRYRNSFSDPKQAYEEKELTRLERESSINAHKISISIQNFIKENSVETYRLDTVIKANPKSKERLQENVALLKEFTTNLEAMLNGRIVIN
ncbi:PF11300 domain protein [Staphylococcus epidermidis VCU123]|nr:PF11300 domain protein [Staphylococcus epidermidis VCU123]